MRVNGLTGQSLESSSSSSSVVVVVVAVVEIGDFLVRAFDLYSDRCTLDLVVVSTVRTYTISFPRYSTMYACKYLQPRI